MGGAAPSLPTSLREGRRRALTLWRPAMSTQYSVRHLHTPDGTVRTVIPDPEPHLTDEEYFDRHPVLREIMERWAAEGRQTEA